jgi:hypothetical protein
VASRPEWVQAVVSRSIAGASQRGDPQYGQSRAARPRHRQRAERAQPRAGQVRQPGAHEQRGRRPARQRPGALERVSAGQAAAALGRPARRQPEEPAEEGRHGQHGHGEHEDLLPERQVSARHRAQRRPCPARPDDAEQDRGRHHREVPPERARRVAARLCGRR